MTDELERIRQEKLRQLMQQQGGSPESEIAQQQMRAAELEKQIKVILNRILEPKARDRLTNIRLARPQFARQIEIFLIQLHQAGRLPKQLSDDELKQILLKLKQQKRDMNIKRV